MFTFPTVVIAKLPSFEQSSAALRFKIRNAADAQMALHLADIPVEFRPERRILDIMDRAVEAAFSICCHTASPGSQM